MQNYWIYGYHAVIAAVNNHKRSIIELVTDNKNLLNDQNLISLVKKRGINIQYNTDIIKNLKIEKSNDQGIAAKVMPINQINLSQAIQNNKTNKNIFVILDQIQDPHNIGAIIRSAFAFGIKNIIYSKNNSPSENSTIVKTACGAFEFINFIEVTNINNAIQELQKNKFWILGLDGNGSQSIEESAKFYQNDNICLVLGNEGSGIRTLVKSNCDNLVKIKIKQEYNFESINVSNAAAIAFYEFSKSL